MNLEKYKKVFTQNRSNIFVHEDISQYLNLFENRYHFCMTGMNIYLSLEDEVQIELLTPLIYPAEEIKTHHDYMNEICSRGYRLDSFVISSMRHEFIFWNLIIKNIKMMLLINENSFTEEEIMNGGNRRITEIIEKLSLLNQK